MGDSQPVRPEDDRRSGSDDLQVNQAQSLFPLRQGLGGDAATIEPFSTVGPRRAQQIGGKWVEKECCRLCLIPPVQFAATCTPFSPIELFIEPSNLPMAMRKKDKKVHAGYDSFLLSCDFSSS